MSNIRIGDKVRVKASLKKGMGVCGEQLNYIGQEFTVACRWGYNAAMLKGNDFVWNTNDLELI